MNAMVAPSDNQFVLRLGDQRAAVVEVGGALRSYVAPGHELLDGYPGEGLQILAQGESFANAWGIAPK